MQDGVLRLQVEEGVIKSVHVGSGLGSVYRDLFASARDDLSATEPKVATSVRVIVFGCFLLEARANEILKAVILEALQQPRAAEAIWQAVERQPFYVKLDVLIAMSPALEPMTVEGITAKVRPLFELRNRLAHFKPDDSEVNIPIPDGIPGLEELARIFLDTPDSDLIQRLKSEEMQELAAVIEEAEEVLDTIYEQHFHGETEHYNDLGEESNEP